MAILDNIVHVIKKMFQKLKNFVIQIDGPPILVIATISDFHGQLEPAYVWSNDGSLQEMGGISRLTTALNNIKQQYPGKVLLFGSGDYFTEDFKVGKYYSAFGGQAITCFLNALPIDASTIGNHEFDFGLKSADKTLCDCTFPFIATNLKQSNLSCQIYKKLVLRKNGYTVGVLGLMLSEIKRYVLAHDASNPECEALQFEQDLYGCTQKAVNELKNQDKVDFVIALSHLGFEEDKLLANNVDGIDVICGGHTHTIIKKNHEFVMDKLQKEKTIIVQSGDRGLYVGVIKLWPKEKGILKYSWDLQEVDATTCAQDKQVEKEVKRLKDLLPGSAVIVTSKCPIDTTKHNLRTRENSFANFVTDVIRDHFNRDEGVTIVLLNASSIRGRGILPSGTIRACDADSWFPFENNFLIQLKVSGKYIKQALELGAAELPDESRSLLHVSGLIYHIDMTKQPGQRVINIMMQQKDNSLSIFDENQEYKVIINSMMIQESLSGVFIMFRNNTILQNTGLTEKELLIKYFKKYKEISPNKVGRMNIDRG